MREKYIDKYIDKADVVVMRGGMNEQALKTTISYLKSCVKEQRSAESEKTKATEKGSNKTKQLRPNNHNERIIPVITQKNKGGKVLSKLRALWRNGRGLLFVVLVGIAFMKCLSIFRR